MDGNPICVFYHFSLSHTHKHRCSLSPCLLLYVFLSCLPDAFMSYPLILFLTFTALLSPSLSAAVLFSLSGGKYVGGGRGLLSRGQEWILHFFLPAVLWKVNEKASPSAWLLENAGLMFSCVATGALRLNAGVLKVLLGSTRRFLEPLAWWISVSDLSLFAGIYFLPLV